MEISKEEAKKILEEATFIGYAAHDRALYILKYATDEGHCILLYHDSPCESCKEQFGNYDRYSIDICHLDDEDIDWCDRCPQCHMPG